MTARQSLRQGTWIGDPSNPTNALKPNSDGSINVNATAGSGGSATGTLSQVASSASAVTILAANTSRKGATVYNASTQILYLGLSTTTPTSSVYTIQMAASSYYEVPFGYTGILRGIWASANGNAVVTEMT